MENGTVVLTKGLIEFKGTSTTFKYYKGLKVRSKTHFYGRAAAEANFSGFLSALLWTVSAFPKCAARARRARFPRARSRRRVVVAALRSVTHAARGAAPGCRRHADRRASEANFSR